MYVLSLLHFRSRFPRTCPVQVLPIKPPVNHIAVRYTNFDIRYLHCIMQWHNDVHVKVFIPYFLLGLIQSTDIANSLISSLVQVNCLILTHHVVYGRSERKRIAFVDVLECLFATNFVPVGMKMVMLSREQVKEFLMLIGSKPDRKHVMVCVAGKIAGCVFTVTSRESWISLI